MEVARLLNNAAKKNPHKNAIIFEGKSISFSQLRDLVFCLANGLEALGLEKDVKVAVYLPNIPEYIYSYFAVYSIGAVIVPLDFSFTQAELESLIRHSDAEILIAQEKKDIDLKALKENLGLKQIVLLGDHQDFINFSDLIKKNPCREPEAEISDADHSTIFYTSGSTGHPKGVLWNYRHLDSPAKAVEYFLHLSGEDTMLCPIPFSHAAGLVFALFMLYFRFTLVVQKRFSPLESLKDIERHGIVFICLVPSMYIAMLSIKEFKKFHLKSLKYAVVFGAPSSPMLLRRFHQACPEAHLLNGWGMTETSPPNAVTPLGSQKIESIGKPIPWLEVRICEEGGRSMPAGEIGELAVRGWPVMLGYYKEPELTKRVIRDGWFYTGDSARIDSEGFIYIVGRKNEMIKVAGERVHAPEIEDVIHRRPEVSEVAVIGVADKLRGEVPKAFLVLKKGKKITENELRYFCREHLAHFKIPHYFEFRDSLPKTRSGKIDKASLAQ
ncbi:class I adenylate-forming enzyme family protein [Candidatus Omnitrophota bacterium]